MDYPPLPQPQCGSDGSDVDSGDGGAHVTELQMVCCWCVECLVATFVDISWVGRRVASVMEDVAQRFDVGVASTLQRACNKGAVDVIWPWFLL